MPSVMRFGLYARSVSVMSKGTVGEQLAEILDDYSKEVKDVTDAAINATAKESVQKLRNSSPKKSGSYAKGWRVKLNRDGSAIVHNATDYQLTHLLENGHVIRNKKGTYGRTNGIKHIEPVEQWANDELVQRIEKDLSR